MLRHQRTNSIPWMGVCVSLFIFVLLVWASTFKETGLGKEFLDISTEVPKNFSTKTPVEFKVPPLMAKAVVVYDLRSGRELYAQNPEAQLPLASLAKIMTVLVSRGTLERESIVIIGEKTLKGDGDGLLKEGDRWSLSNLLDWALVRSSNDAAVAIASSWEGVRRGGSHTERDGNFVDAMNAGARDLSLAQTYFLNETGLDINSQIPGAYGSARDVAKLLTTAVIKFGDSFEATKYSTLETASLDDKTHKTKNTNKIVETIPGVIASKTGFTDLSGGNLAILFDAGPHHPIAIVVLGSSPEGRFEDVAKLIESTLAYLKESN